MPANKEFDASLNRKNYTGPMWFGIPRHIVLSIAGVAILAGAGIYGLKFAGFLDKGNAKTLKNSTTYRTNGKVELHEEKDANSPIRASLKEGTILSGRSVGAIDGIEWVEVTSVDGARGFLPISGLTKIGEGADLSQVQNSQRRVVTSTQINIRATPSLSAAIIGTIDGGTRVSSDGYVASQGEDWLRLRLGKDTTGFIMARFTTPDDDAKNASDSVAQKKIGASGLAKMVTNVQATPFADGRIIRSLLEGDEVGVIGQTKTDDWWYIIRLTDGTQGFVPKATINIPMSEGKWVYPDGSLAAGPNIPQSPKAANGIGGTKTVSYKQNGNSKSQKKAGSGAKSNSNKLPTADNPVKVEFDNPNPEPAPKTE